MCYARRQRSSWARIKLSKSLYQNNEVSLVDLILLSSLALSFFYFCFWVVFSFKELFEIRFAHTYMLCTSLLLFNFQRSVRLSAQPRFRATLLLYHFQSDLSIPFSKLFSSFFHLLFHVFTSPHLRQLAYITIYFPFCQALLHNFFDNFWLFSLNINLCTPFHSLSTTLSTVCIVFFHQKFGFRTVEDAGPYFFR